MNVIAFQTALCQWELWQWKWSWHTILSSIVLWGAIHTRFCQGFVTVLCLWTMGDFAVVSGADLIFLLVVLENWTLSEKSRSAKPHRGVTILVTVYMFLFLIDFSLALTPSTTTRWLMVLWLNLVSLAGCEMCLIAFLRYLHKTSQINCNNFYGLEFLFSTIIYIILTNTCKNTTIETSWPTPGNLWLLGHLLKGWRVVDGCC